MTGSDTSVTITEVDSIERQQATRPWGLNSQTVQAIDHIEGLHRRIDTVYVPQVAPDPVDYVEALFTMDPRVLARRDRDVGDVVQMVVDEIEDDSRLEEYVIWDAIEPVAEVADIDDSRTRVRVTWKTRGGDE